MYTVSVSLFVLDVLLLFYMKMKAQAFWFSFVFLGLTGSRLIFLSHIAFFPLRSYFAYI